MTINPSPALLKAMQQQHHPDCLVCGGRDAKMGLDFRITGNGTVEATFDCARELQGYPDRLHGGVICTLIDGAMANCLFAYGLAGVTAELKVRFRERALLGESATVRATIFDRLPPLFRLNAEVVQGTMVVATAEGTFVDRMAVGRLPFRSSSA